MEWIGPAITAAGAIIIALIELYAVKDRNRIKNQAQKIEKEAKKNAAVVDGVLALLRNEIINKYNHYTDKGYIPIYGMENVTSLYNAYRELGGNGTAAKLVDALRELPTDPPE